MGNIGSDVIKGAMEGLEDGISSGIANYGRYNDHRQQGVTAIKYGPYGTQLYFNDADSTAVALGMPLETVLPSHRCDMNVQRACKNLRATDILMSNRGSGVVMDVRNTGSPFGSYATVRSQ